METLRKNINEFRSLFSFYCTETGLEQSDFCVDEPMLVKVLIKTDEKKLAYKIFHHIDMSELKVAGVLAYYFAKFRPIIYHSPLSGVYKARTYNEEFAIFLINSVLNEHNHVISEKAREKGVNIPVLTFPLPEKIIHHLWYELVNRRISCDSLALLVESLAEMPLESPPIEENV